MKSEPNNLIAKYEIHNLLINECTARIVDENDGTILRTILLGNVDKVQNINGDITKVELPPIPETMLEKRIAKIQIWHNDLGLVRDDPLNTDKSLEDSHDVNVDYSEQVFIVHGHDPESKYQLARIIENEFHLKAIILHELPDLGKTIIEKLEGALKLPGYVFVLLTPDDIGAEKTQDITITDLKVKDLKIDFKYRARQNVVLELGYFIGKLGRSRVCCLYKGELDLPSDISGILYKKFTNNISEVYGEIRKELKAAGYNV